ncbi:hypothetical protein RND81_09G241800 [Saponaria officinalis]|uniref:Uncharacterized protein n=1 Tax=Saponaria officinalis TaxID=3572 RepID=A0AAW1IRR7_SAPOF
MTLVNFERALHGSRAKNMSFDEAEAFIEMYIFRQIESQSYMTAVSLLEQFGVRHSGESFLSKMIEANDFSAAEKWASYTGKSMLCVIVLEYVKMNMLKGAYGIIKRNNLQEEFPAVYHKCKESALKTLAEKGCWNVAEGKAKNDRQLLEYLTGGWNKMVSQHSRQWIVYERSPSADCTANSPQSLLTGMDLFVSVSRFAISTEILCLNKLECTKEREQKGTASGKALQSVPVS